MPGSILFFPYYKSQGSDINIATTVNLLPEDS
jgi:hypothetical protein